MKTKNIYIVGGSVYRSYVNWIESLGWQIVDDIKSSDLVFFAGGEDVSPNLYGEKNGSYTGTSPRRDASEVSAWNRAVEFNLPCVGVCRGSQFLTVMNGGKLVQDMNHNGFHEVQTNDGRTILFNSLHHQQMLVDTNHTKLEANDFELIAWTVNQFAHHLNGDDVNYNFAADYKEPEIVWFPKTRCLCIQMHPEMLDQDSEAVEYCQDLFMSKFDNEGLVTA